MTRATADSLLSTLNRRTPKPRQFVVVTSSHTSHNNPTEERKSLMPTDQPQSESTYFIDAESAAEMARLMIQDRLLTKGMGGLFPERADLSNLHRILDIGCGPGAWALDVADAYPVT